MNINTLLSAMIAQLQAQKVTDTETNQTTQSTTASGEDFESYLNAATEDNRCGATTLNDIFEQAAATYNVDADLLRAIGMAESGFRADATSHCGAQGIMQLMPSTAEYLGVEDAYDAKQNIFGGAKYISQLLRQYNGDASLALAAYNAGSGNVAKYGGIPPFEETQNYVKKVLGYYEDGVSIPADRNIVSVTSEDVVAQSEGQEEQSLLQQLQSAMQALQGNDIFDELQNMVSSSEDSDTVAIWNTDELGTVTTKTTDSESMLSQLQELLLAMNEENTEFSYEDYGRFVKVYLDRVSLTTFQNAVKGEDTSVPEELEETLEEFQAEMNGEETSNEQNLDSMYSYQSINYNPTVLKLLSTDEA